MAQSRLARRTIKQSKQQLYYSLAAIVAVMIIAFNFGPLLIGGLGGIIDTITGKGNQATKIITDADIQPPRIDPLPDATPSARINVSGSTDYAEGVVELYVNNSRFRTSEIKSQTFIFERVLLTKGINYLKARVIIGDKKSDFSEEAQISYTKNAPKLDVTAPVDKQSFSKADQQITMRGTTDPENSVNVNGFIAIVDSAGNFTYDFRLNNGENKLTITAIAKSGQTTTKELTVSYSE